MTAAPMRGATRWAIWLPGLAVAVGAAVATAHGLYEVAAAARVPAVIAWLYPLITDGLALVAYVATARLSGSAARYAWSVVVLAAGLSGLAQAAYLAADSAVEASSALRFGVGAWPAVAAAIVAHLLYLLATDSSDAQAPGRTAPFVPDDTRTVQPDRAPIVQPVPPVERAVRLAIDAGPVERPAVRAGRAPARDRARTAAERHAHRHGALPTVTELEVAAEVSRGTAATVLKALREEPAAPIPLHLVTTSSDRHDQDDDPTIEKATHP